MTKVYTQLLDTIGPEEFGIRCIARDALYNEYGFTPDLTRIHIYEFDDNGRYIRFGVGRHVYQVQQGERAKNEFTKVE